MTTHFPAAILWDLDGTLINTEPYWLAAEGELVREFGGEWHYEKALQLIGQGLWVAASAFQKEGVTLDADSIVARLTARVQQQLQEFGAPWRPGALELLTEARESGVRQALVTMSVESMAKQVVELIGFDVFETLVTGDMVSRPKPDPDPYLLAAERLGVNIADCIAIEDSEPGVASAVAAGARVVAVPHIVPIAESSDHVRLSTLNGVNLAKLIEVAK